jgi:hypothetical protein
MSASARGLTSAVSPGSIELGGYCVPNSVVDDTLPHLLLWDFLSHQVHSVTIRLDDLHSMVAASNRECGEVTQFFRMSRRPALLLGPPCSRLSQAGPLRPSANSWLVISPGSVAALSPASVGKRGHLTTDSRWSVSASDLVLQRQLLVV